MFVIRFLALPTSFLLLASAPAAAADTGVVRGHVVKLDAAANRISVRPTAGADVTLAVTATSRLEAGGKPATLAQFKEGQRVRATYTEKAGAKEVVLLKPAVTTDDELRREVKQALAAAKDYTFQQKEKYQAELRGVMDDLDDRIDHLTAEAKDAGADAKKAIQEKIAELRKRRDALDGRLEKVKSATAEAWEDVKSGVGSAAADVADWLDRVLKK